MRTAHVFISGFVQGVGYRAFVRSNARKLGVVGWVRNTNDRKVEALFIGSKETIEKIIEECKKGPMLSEVKDVWVEWEEEVQQFENFEIVI